MADDEVAVQRGNERVDLSIKGRSGLQRWGGVIYEEQLPQLKGTKWIQTIKQMADNDSIIGSVMFAIEMLIRQVPMSVQPATEDNADLEVADFVQSLFDDMSDSWADTTSEILSFLPYGWSYMEMVYKLRQGDQVDPKRRSKYVDGKIGWRKWSIRSQDTLDRWEFNEEDGDIEGLFQRPPPDYEERFIPIEKALLFRTTSRKNSPEGKSVLRNAYRAWYFKSRLENVEGIGAERDLAGLPVMWVPWEFLSENATVAQQAIVDQLKTIITNIRRDEQEGVLLPAWMDAHGNQLFKLELIASAGKRQFNTNDIISRYETRIAMSVLADVILMGHAMIGSYALSNVKTDLFTAALRAYVDSMADVINRHAIPRILKLNGYQLESLPQVVFGDIDNVNLEELGNYLNKLAGHNLILPTPELDAYLKQVANLPVATYDSPLDARMRAELEKSKALQIEEAEKRDTGVVEEPVPASSNGQTGDQE